MAEISKNTKLDIKIDGKNFLVPREYFDFSVKVTYGNNNQTNITFTELTLVGDARQYILDWIDNGLKGGVGIFEGIPLTFSVSNNVGSQEVFNGIIDLQDRCVIDNDARSIQVNIKQDNGLNNLDDLVSGLDFNYLYQEGAITDSDFVNVDYSVIVPNPVSESAIIFVTGYLLSKQIQDSIKELAYTVSEVAGIFAAGLTGAIGAAIVAAAKAVALAAYSAFLLVILLDLGLDLVEIITTPKRTHKGVKLKTLLEKAFNYIGYDLNTTITEFDNLVYLPSNKNTDSRGARALIEREGTIERGIPFATDYGFTVPELLELIRLLFNARFYIDRNVVQVHSANSDFWIKRASYNLLSVNVQPFVYNTNEMIASILVGFTTDITDEYTIDEYKGTTYQVLIDAQTTIDPKKKTIKGAEQINIPVCLGVRKNNLTGFENVISDFAGIFDDLTRTFGGSSNLKSNIDNKIGILKVSNNNHTLPKLLYYEGNRLPADHREKFNAKVLYDKYWNYINLKANNFAQQKKVFEGVTIPFGFNDFLTLINNSYFYNDKGQLCEAVEFEWSTLKDKAVISYKEPFIYTKNLRETFIEPE